MSGGYTSRTGLDILNLPFHLLVDVCHDTIQQRLTGDPDAVAQWRDHLDAPTPRWSFPALPYAAAAAAAQSIGTVLHGDDLDGDPAGWDDVTLLQQMQAGARR